MKKYLLLLVSLMLVSPSAFAHLSIVGGIDYGLNSTTIADPTGLTSGVAYKSGLGFGGGLLYNFSAIEIGALYLSKKSTATILGVDVSTTGSAIEIPVMFRMGGMFTNFGIGGFYDIYTGSLSGSNYGLTAGPHIGTPGGLFFDLRFNYGLKSQSAFTNTEDLLGLVGYAFH